MKPITFAYWSVKRIISLEAATVAAALLAITTVLTAIHTPPFLENGLVDHDSFHESRQIVSQAAPLMSHCSMQYPPGDWYPLRKKCLLEVLKCAMNLSPFGDANAEYIIGWGYENGLYTRPLDLLLQPLYEISVPSAKDNRAVAYWYERADEHGSPEASLALGFYEKALARGNEEARIVLGQCSEDLNTEAGARRAMAFYEQASKAKSVLTVDNAVFHILWLWKSNRARPSAEFSRGKSSAFDFLSSFDHTMNSQLFADFFTISYAVPNTYGQYRGEILPRIRRALGLSSENPAAAILSLGLKDDNPDVRDQARSALAELGDGAVPELTRLLSDRSTEMRSESLQLLSRLGRDAEPAISPMANLLENDPDDQIQQEAKIALRSVGPAAEPVLIKLLNHPAASVRADTAEALAYVGTKEAVPALMKTLQAPEEKVFSATADSLGAIGPEAASAMPTLIQWLQYPDRDSRYRAAHHAICMNFKAAAVPALVQSLQADAPESQRKACARCLCDMGRDAVSAVPALIQLTHSEYPPALHIFFVDALAFTGSQCPDAISALKLLAEKDLRPDVRHQAAMRLDEISRGIL